jgi:hypothetical protein
MALVQVSERVSTGRWLGDCFVYVNANDRLNYCVVRIFGVLIVDRFYDLRCHYSTSGRRSSDPSSLGQKNVFARIHGKREPPVFDR